MTIEPTDIVQKHAKDALLMQDACNSGGVINSLADIKRALSKDALKTGTDAVNQHPIIIVILDKLNSLARIQGSGNLSRIMKAYDAVDRLSRGESAEWEVLA